MNYKVVIGVLGEIRGCQFRKHTHFTVYALERTSSLMQNTLIHIQASRSPYVPLGNQSIDGSSDLTHIAKLFPEHHDIPAFHDSSSDELVLGRHRSCHNVSHDANKGVEVRLSIVKWRTLDFQKNAIIQ